MRDMDLRPQKSMARAYVGKGSSSNTTAPHSVIAAAIRFLEQSGLFCRGAAFVSSAMVSPQFLVSLSLSRRMVSEMRFFFSSTSFTQTVTTSPTESTSDG